MDSCARTGEGADSVMIRVMGIRLLRVVGSFVVRRLCMWWPAGADGDEKGCACARVGAVNVICVCVGGGWCGCELTSVKVMLRDQSP